MMQNEIIMLLIQLAFNGVFLFIIQKYIENRIINRQHKITLREEIYKQYFTKIYNSISYIRLTIEMKFYGNEDGVDISTFKDDLEGLKKKLLEVISYYYTYKVILDTNTKDNQAIIEKLDNLIDTPNHIDDSEVDNCIKFYNECNNLLEKLSDNTLKQIY